MKEEVRKSKERMKKKKTNLQQEEIVNESGIEKGIT